MGIRADAALAAGGKVIGVIPHFPMDWELAHNGLTHLIAVSSLPKRERRMADLIQSQGPAPDQIELAMSRFAPYTRRHEFPK